jgi:hypothetical protein
MAVQQVLLSYGATAPTAVNTVALLHMDGTNGSTSFPDDTGKTWTAFGNAQVTTTDPHFGTGALLLDGAGDYIESGTVADFGFGTGDFCIECFVRPTAITGNQVVASLGGTWVLYLDGFGQLFVFNGSINVVGAASGISTTTYQHIAWVRQSGQMRLYSGGALLSSATDTTSFGATNQITVGRRPVSNDLFWNGRIDEFRVSKVHRYSGSAFTVPTAPFTLD